MEYWSGSRLESKRDLSKHISEWLHTYIQISGELDAAIFAAAALGKLTIGLPTEIVLIGVKHGVFEKNRGGRVIFKTKNGNTLKISKTQNIVWLQIDD